VGYNNEATIESSYAAGSIDANSAAGGLVGCSTS